MLRCLRENVLIGLMFARLALGAEIIVDIRYESPGSSANLLDLYLPDGGALPGAPTVVYIHGGGWSGGDKSIGAAYCRTLADMGYPAVSCNYTLSTPTEPSFPQAVIDVKNVVRWVKHVGAADYGLRGPVIATGSSAGGHLAMMLATTAGDAEFEILDPPTGGYRVAAFVDMWGPSDLVWQIDTYGQHPTIIQFLGEPLDHDTRARYEHASPLYQLDACDPPGALFQCEGDPVVPYPHAVMMADALGVLGIYHDLTLRPGGSHGFGTWGGTGPMAELVALAIPALLEHATSPDFNGDGGVSTLDVLAFLHAWSASDPAEDFNGDGSVNTLDVLAFLNAWSAGC